MFRPAGTPSLISRQPLLTFLPWASRRSLSTQSPRMLPASPPIAEKPQQFADHDSFLKLQCVLITLTEKLSLSLGHTSSQHSRKPRISLQCDTRSPKGSVARVLCLVPESPCSWVQFQERSVHQPHAMCFQPSRSHLTFSEPLFLYPKDHALY